jgi:endogenous inhibitor of DNA gyrase (YacG/DUF329 family)
MWPFCSHKWEIIDSYEIAKKEKISGVEIHIGNVYFQKCSKCQRIRKWELKLS